MVPKADSGEGVMRRQSERSNIAGAINAAHAGVEAAKREGARYATECGRLLIQAKETVPHGGWDAWLRLNTVVSPRTAQLYMRIARHVEGDPAKAQRVAGLSLREAAAEASGERRATVARKPLSPEGEAQVEEMLALWRKADQWPHAKEAFAREIHRRGEIPIEERNRIIKGAWSDPALTDEARQEAMRKIAFAFKDRVPADKLKPMLPALGEMAGTDVGIALGDAVEARHSGG